jgi:hypothetical protein
MYVGVEVSLSGYETEVNLMPLELYDFNIILGMISWVSIDCYTKTDTF